MSIVLVSSPRIQLLDTNGAPVVGAKLYISATGSSTPVPTYTSSALTIEHTNPIISDANGYFPAIFPDPDLGALKFRFFDANDVSLGIDTDPAFTPDTALTQAEVGAALYPVTDAEDAAGLTPTDYSYRPGHLMRYGAIGNGIDDDTTAITSAFAYSHSAKAPCFVPSGRFKYTGGEITNAYCAIVGECRPRANSGNTALENGSTFVGTLTFRCDTLILENFGVDHGSAGFGSGADALFAGHPTASGVYARFHNVIGLGRDPDDQFHAVGCEGYEFTDLQDIIGIRNWYGLAAKVQNANIRNIKAYENVVAGLVVRSNNPAGIVNDLIVSDVLTEGVGNQGSGSGGSDYGTYIVVDDQAQRIIVNNVQAKACKHGVSIRPNANVNDVIVSNVIGSDVGEGALYAQSSTGDLYSLIASNIEALDCQAWGVYIEKAISVQLANVYASSIAASSYIDEIVRIGVDVESSVLDNIITALNRSQTNIGGIRYDNSYPENTIGTHRAKLFGVGVPRPGFSEPSVSGATVTLTPVYDSGQRSIIKAAHGGGAITVTTIATQVDSSPAQNFPYNYRLVVINDGVTDMTMESIGATGFITRVDAVDDVITPSRAIEYVFQGAQWVPVS